MAHRKAAISRAIAAPTSPLSAEPACRTTPSAPIAAQPVEDVAPAALLRARAGTAS